MRVKENLIKVKQKMNTWVDENGGLVLGALLTGAAGITLFGVYQRGYVLGREDGEASLARATHCSWLYDKERTGRLLDLALSRYSEEELDELREGFGFVEEGLQKNGV